MAITFINLFIHLTLKSLAVISIQVLLTISPLNETLRFMSISETISV